MLKSNLYLCAIACALFVSAVSGCNSKSETQSDAKPEVQSDTRFGIVTTCGMVTDIVRQVAGDDVEVIGLMGEGVDPHLHKPTRSDVKRLLEADIVFYSGLLLEGRMGAAFEGAEKKGIPVHAVTESIETSFLRTPPEFEGHPDPHLWMDVSAWSKCVSEVVAKLSEFDPPHADEYARNGTAYQAELKNIDHYARTVIDSIPENQRVLVTAHDAFGYFSRAYGIKIHPIQGISTEPEAAVKDINEIVDFIVETKLPAIFVESSVSKKNILAVIEGAESRGWKVKIGGVLFSDAMGAPGTYEGTYIGMIDHNATVIARALGGEAPRKGMNGKLSDTSNESAE